MPRRAIARAPGKVILVGEHSVVYGEPAIAAAIDRELAVTLGLGDGNEGTAPPAPDERLDLRGRTAVALVAQRFGFGPAALGVAIESALPQACGLGSSAAFSLALVRAAAALAGRRQSRREETALAAEVEDVFHGTASGVDVAAVAQDGILWFERGDEPRVEEIFAPAPITLVVALSGEARSTVTAVARLRVRRQRFPRVFDPLLRRAGDLVGLAREAIVAGDWPALGAAMDAAHGLLNAFGVSTPALERMLHVARAAGALGAKLTGGGGGGAMIALAPENAAAVADALVGAGFEAFVTRIGTSREVHDAVASPSHA
jgi:mevalonate kinase